MSYEEMFDKAEAEGQTKPLSVEIISWDSEGQTVIGKLIDIEIFQGDKEKGDCNAYILEADRGLVSFILGSATDKRLQDLEVGNIMKVVYRGQKEIKGGNRVNLFNIMVINHDTSI